MNKKHILCIFVVLILTITKSSYALPKPIDRRANTVMRKSFNVPPEERFSASNTTKTFADDDNNFSAIGLLSFKTPDGNPDFCTGTVIKTDNGNMVLTAAHCLWNFLGNNWNSDVYFSPGYDNGNDGNLGKISARSVSIWQAHTSDETLFDYGFVKLFYPDGRKLQDDAGAFDVEFDIPGGDYPVTVFGYPAGGEMPDCPKDGEHLCQWQGNTFDFTDPNLPNHDRHRGIPIDVGGGSSGGPWIRDYDRNTNTGVIDGVSHGMLPSPYPQQGTTTWKWQNDDFSELLKDAEEYNPPQ